MSLAESARYYHTHRRPATDTQPQTPSHRHPATDTQPQTHPATDTQPQTHTTYKCISICTNN